MFLFKKWNHIVLPYKVYLEDDHLAIEAYGVYNEAYLVFRGMIKSNTLDLQQIYLKLNENMVKRVGLKIEHRDVYVFDFEFTNLLSKEEIKCIDVYNKKAIIGGMA